MKVMNLRSGAIFLAACLVVGAATTGADVASRKFARIEEGRLPAGTRVDLTAAELTAWARSEAQDYAPGAVRNALLRTGSGEATGTASIDFLKLRSAATGEDPGFLMRNLFAGERSVKVVARFESRNRKARVHVVRVEVSGVVIEGSVLDFLIQNWLKPTFPDVKVDEWFDLGYRIDHFTVAPIGVSLFIGK